jgi:hypothetical protein
MVPTSASTLPGRSGHPDHVTGELQVLLQWEGGTVEHDAGVAVANALHDLVEGRAVVQVEAGDDVAAADHRGDQCDHVLVSGVGGLHGVHAVDDRCLQTPQRASGCIAANPAENGLCTASFGALCGEMSSRAQRGSLCEVGSMFG